MPKSVIKKSVPRFDQLKTTGIAKEYGKSGNFDEKYGEAERKAFPRKGKKKEKKEDLEMEVPWKHLRHSDS